MLPVQHVSRVGILGICDIVTMYFNWARPKSKTDLAVSRLWSHVCDSRKWCCGVWDPLSDRWHC